MCALGDQDVAVGKHELDPPPCDFIPEIVLVQDITASFQDDQPNLLQLLPMLLKNLIVLFKGEAKIGLVSFGDKPIEKCGFGFSNDYCASLDYPLTAVQTDEDITRFVQALRAVEVGGGYDMLDGTTEAVYRAALSPQLGWSKEKKHPVSGKPIAKIILLATDAAFHAPKSGQLYCGQGNPDLEGNTVNLKPNDMLHRPKALSDSIDAECGTIDYPDHQDLAEVLKTLDINSIIFAGEPVVVSANGEKRLSSQYKKQIVKTYNFTDTNPWKDLSLGLVNFYRDYYEKLLNVPVFVKKLNNDSSNFVDIFNEAFDQLSKHFCEKDKNTTTSTTTISTTTLSTTTVSTTSVPDSTSFTETTESTTMSSTDNILPVPPPSPVPHHKSNSGIVAGAASGGALAALGAAYMTKRIVWPPRADTPDMDITQEADHVDPPHDREQFEAVTGDLFA